MDSAALMKSIMTKLDEADGAIGREIAAQREDDPASPAPSEVLLAVATGHIMTAKHFLEMVGGSRLVAAIFHDHAEAAAAETA